MADKAAAWIRFLRLHRPGSSNDSWYDETIRTSARRNGFRPIEFEPPVERDVQALFGRDAALATSVVLTGTTGDGRSNLCREVWGALGVDDALPVVLVRSSGLPAEVLTDKPATHWRNSPGRPPGRGRHDLIRQPQGRGLIV